MSADVAARRRRLWHVAGWVLSAATIVAVGLLLRGRFDEVRSADVVPPAWAMVVAVLVNIVGNGVLVSAWQRIVRLVGPRLDWVTAAAIWAPSQLARFTLAVAQVGARAALAARHGVTLTSGAVTTLVEIGWTAAINPLLILATWTAWSGPASSLSWVPAVAVIPAGVLVLGVLDPVRLLQLVAWGLRLPGLRRFGARHATRVDEIEIDRGAALRLTGLYVLNNGLRLVAFLVILGAAGGTEAVGAAAVGAFALGQFVGRLALFAPGGIGPREGATALVLAPLVGSGPALGVVAFTRLAELAGEIAFLGIAVVADRRRRTDNRQPEHSDA